MSATNDDRPYIQVDHSTSPADQEILISLHHLPPNRLITMEAQTSTPYYCINVPVQQSGLPWRAQAQYLSDNEGTIDMRTDPSLSGSFTGLHPMGLLYCLSPVQNAAPRTPQSPLPARGFTLHLRAMHEGAVLCDKEIRRNYLTEQSRVISVQGQDYRGVLYHPGGIKAPAIMVLSGSEGGSDKARNIAQMLCSHGFAALAIGYFHAEGLAENLDGIALEIVERALEYLSRRDDIDAGHIGLYGRSKGAEMALAAAQRIPGIAAVVANSPSAQVLEGIKGRMPSRGSSWTWRGKELAYRKFGIRDLLKRNPSSDSLHHPASTALPYAIESENIKAPLLMFASTRDEIWPAFASMRALSERRVAHDIDYPTIAVPCTSVGHMLTIPWMPNPRYPSALWHTNAQECARAWKTTLEFFGVHLGIAEGHACPDECRQA